MKFALYIFIFSIACGAGKGMAQDTIVYGYRPEVVMRPMVEYVPTVVHLPAPPAPVSVVISNPPPKPIIVNVPIAQTVWFPVTTVVQQPLPLYYYPYVSYVPVVHQPATVIQERRCWWFNNHRRY